MMVAAYLRAIGAAALLMEEHGLLERVEEVLMLEAHGQFLPKVEEQKLVGVDFVAD